MDFAFIRPDQCKGYALFCACTDVNENEEGWHSMREDQRARWTRKAADYEENVSYLR